MAALAWLRVGRTLARLGRPAEAEPLPGAAHATLRALLGPENVYTRSADEALGELEASRASAAR